MQNIIASRVYVEHIAYCVPNTMLPSLYFIVLVIMLGHVQSTLHRSTEYGVSIPTALYSPCSTPAVFDVLVRHSLECGDVQNVQCKHTDPVSNPSWRMGKRKRRRK